MEGITESFEEKQKNELKYFAALSVLRNIYKSGKISLTVLERINEKNAEKTACRAVSLQ